MWEEIYRRYRKTPRNRITEHKCNIKMGAIFKSKKADHSMGEDHRIQWEKAEIIHREESRVIMKLKELVFIRTNHQSTKPRREFIVASSTVG
jgi:hypothetical protein